MAVAVIPTRLGLFGSPFAAESEETKTPKAFWKKGGLRQETGYDVTAGASDESNTITV